jgi:hypothetical protein
LGSTAQLQDNAVALRVMLAYTKVHPAKAVVWVALPDIFLNMGMGMMQQPVPAIASPAPRAASVEVLISSAQHACEDNTQAKQQRRNANDAHGVRGNQIFVVVVSQLLFCCNATV